MSATGSGYDYTVTTYSPNGRVFQVEYAQKAIEKTGTVLGVCCKDGVVLGAEKSIVSKMLVPGSNKRIQTIGVHSGLASAGIAADARQLVNKGRQEAKEYKSFYGHAIPGKVLSQRVAGHVHTHTLYWYLRPYGCSALLANYDHSTDGPGLWLIEPSGVCYKYFGCAIGKHKQGAKTELEKINFSEITCREAVSEIAKIIYKLHDDVKDKAFELELTWVCDESDRKHATVPAELADAAVKAAVEAKEKAEMEDSEDEAEKKDK